MEKKFKIERKFEIQGENPSRLFREMNEAVIDNGAVKVRIDLYSLRRDLTDVGLSEAGINAIMNKLQAYDSEVTAEKSKGTHLGSTMLEVGLAGAISGLSPQELGLQTEKELALIAILIARLTSHIKE